MRIAVVGKGGSGIVVGHNFKKTDKNMRVPIIDSLMSDYNLMSEKSKVENEKMLKLFGNDKRVKTSSVKRPGRYANRKGSWKRFGKIQIQLQKKSTKK